MPNVIYFRRSGVRLEENKEVRIVFAPFRGGRTVVSLQPNQFYLYESLFGPTLGTNIIAVNVASDKIRQLTSGWDRKEKAVFRSDLLFRWYYHFGLICAIMVTSYFLLIIRMGLQGIGRTMSSRQSGFEAALCRLDRLVRGTS